MSERWDGLYKSSKRLEPDRIRIRMDSIPEDMKGNLTGKQHANWNKDAVLLMYREGIIDITDLHINNPTECMIDVKLNNISVLEDKTKLEEYIAAFRDSERQAINDNKNSIYTLLKYHSDECFSTFFTKEFPFAPDTCSGCPYCRSKKKALKFFPGSIQGTKLESTKMPDQTTLFDNISMNRLNKRRMTFITHYDELTEGKYESLTELFIRYGVECLVRDCWGMGVLKKLSDFDRGNYLLLTYEEFYRIDPSWIGGPIVLFLSNDGNKNDEIFEIGQSLADNDKPVVFVGKSSVRIDSEQKSLKELVNFNTPLDYVIEGESL